MSYSIAHTPSFTGPIAILRDVRLVAVAIGVLLSLWRFYLDVTVNSDGVLYLTAADFITTGQWREAMGVYQWLFYPWLISLTHTVTGLPTELAAHALDGMFSALTVYFFITLVRELTTDQRVLVAAAVIILIQPQLVGYRADVIRDHGYWACYMASLVYFLRMYKTGSLYDALMWGVTMIIGLLFRIEGLVILLALPLIVFARPATPALQKLALWLRANALTLGSTLGVLSWHWATGQGSLGSLGRLAEPLEKAQLLLNAQLNGIPEKLSVLRADILSTYSEEYAPYILALIVMSLIVMKAIKVVGPLYVALSFHAYLVRRPRPPGHVVRVLLWAVVINLLILTGHTTLNFFVTGRFVIPLALTLMVLAPYSLAYVFERWHERRPAPLRRNWVWPLVCVLLFVMTVDVLDASGVSKSYIREAGTWLRDNVPTDARLYTNNRVIHFYSRNKTPWREPHPWARLPDFVNSGEAGSYDYLAFKVSRKYPEWTERLLELLGPHLVADLANERGDRVLVFQPKRSAPPASKPAQP